MPIVIAQPDMVSPQISGGYGAAVQFSTDFPTLQRQQAEIAQANLAYGGRQAAAQMQSAALQAHQQALNTSIEGNARQMEQQENYGMANQQYQQAAHAALDQQHAELQSWVNSQEMTQADQMRLQRLQQGISAVQSDPSLNEADRMSLIGMMRSQIDPLQARQALQLEKHQKQQDALQAAQEQKIRIAENAQKTFDAQTAQQHTSAIYNPAVLEQLGREYDEANPQLAAMAKLLGGDSAAAFEATKKEVIQAMAAKDPDGILGHSIEVGPGKKEIQWRKDQVDNSEKIAADREKRFMDAQKHYDTLHSAAVARIDKLQKENPDTPQEQKTREWIMENAAADLAAKKVFPPTPPEPVQAKKAGPRENPFLPKKQSDTVSEAPTKEGPKVADIFAKKNEVEQRPDLPIEVKREILDGMGWAIQTIDKAGGYNKLSEEQKKKIHALGLKYDRLPPPPAPAPVAAPVAPIGATRPIDPRSSIYMRQR